MMESGVEEPSKQLDTYELMQTRHYVEQSHFWHTNIVSPAPIPITRKASEVPEEGSQKSFQGMDPDDKKYRYMFCQDMLYTRREGVRK